MSFGPPSENETIRCTGRVPARNVPHADCCIHPPGRNEMIAITPPKNFSKEVAQNRPPHFPARTSSPPEIVSDQISGDEAWMNFRFSRALPPGGLSLTPGREAFHPMDAAGPDHLFAYAVTLASLYDYAKNVFNLYSMRRAGKVYPHEIDIQETQPKHRKLDSQAALPHPTRD